LVKYYIRCWYRRNLLLKNTLPFYASVRLQVDDSMRRPKRVVAKYKEYTIFIVLCSWDRIIDIYLKLTFYLFLDVCCNFCSYEILRMYISTACSCMPLFQDLTLTIQFIIFCLRMSHLKGNLDIVFHFVLAWNMLKTWCCGQYLDLSRRK